MRALVGYTGFVGGHLYAGGGYDRVYNSKNIEESFGTEPDLLVFAGLRAEKYLANREPGEDLARIREAQENIRRIGAKRVVLISTIDVFKTPVLVDEMAEVDTEGLQPYGYHRYLLEQWVREHYGDALIIRLPGLFGKGIKKNFIYDYIHVIPAMLKAEKFAELSERAPVLREYFAPLPNGFYKSHVPADKEEDVKGIFRSLGFSALNFTDSRSCFQFYNLSRLPEDMEKALHAGLKVFHPATPPVSAGELYQYLSGEKFENILPSPPAMYDYRTRYASVFGGKDGYICTKGQILEEICSFVKE